MPSLTSLPLEPLQHIAFHLVARTPLGPPGALLPLLLVSRHVHAALTSSPALLARIFRLKFDVSAVTRRLFAPHARDLAAQLVAACELLRFLRTAPSPHHIEATSHLDTALLMMLDNDGKNYAQLAHAGVHAFLRAYAHTRLWEGREENEGWPRDSQANAAAVWLLWLTAERTHLLAESPTERELAISAILPFVVLPQRYAASYAPPNHFSLPLRHPSSSSSSSHTQTQTQIPITFRLPNSHKRYPHYLPQRAHSVHHFRAILTLTAPPCSIPAKLLFVARRELRPAAVPAHAPPGPGGPGMPLTQDDYRALNSARAAVLPRGAKWDWDKGSAVEVNPRLGAGGVERERRAIAAGDEESRRWDATFWKMRLCGDYMDPGPLFRPGEVYDPGSMRGLWQGKIYIPQGAQFNHILQNPAYPSIVNPELVHAQLNRQFQLQGQQQQQHNPRLFSESSLQLVMQPLFLDMQEHHRICMCAGRCSHSHSRSDSCAAENGDEEGADDTGMEGGCGIVPTRAPLSVLIRADASVADTDTDIDEDASSTSASVSAGPAPSHLHPHPHPEGEAPPVASPPAHPHSGPNDDVGDAPHAYIGPQSVDLGMCNAWFEGAQGGVVCVPRPGGKEKRGEVVVATGFARPDLGVRGGCPGVPGSGSGSSASSSSTSSGAGPSASAGVGASSTGADSSSSDEDQESATASGTGTTTKTRSRSSGTQGGSINDKNKSSSSSRSYVYETYDPRKRSSHDVHVPHGHSSAGAAAAECVSCARHAEARMVQKRREEEEARRMLDRAMRGFGRGRERGRRPRRREHPLYSEDEEELEQGDEEEEEDFSMDVEEELQGEEEEEMQDLDMEDVELGFRFGDVLAAASSSSTSSSSTSDSDYDTDSDSYPDALDLDLDNATLDTDDLDAFAAHTCAPGKKHYVRIVEAEDEDLHTFPLVSAASGNGKGRERLEVLGDDRPRGEDGFVVYTCLSGNGRAERKRKRGQSASPAEATMAMVGERKECSTKRARMSAGASGTTMASTSSSSGPDEMLHNNPHAQPSASTSTHPHHHKHAHATQIVHATRREFDRARIGTACTGTRDILLTGCLPSPSSSSSTQPQYFPSSLYSDVSVYGRVRRWDGLVGMLRMSRAGAQGGGGGTASFLFVFGYVVGARAGGAGGGGGSFVGEWRIAGSDPMRPSWGGAFVMSRLEEEGEVV